MLKKLLLTILCILFFSSTFAFDGNRKGFAMNTGVGADIHNNSTYHSDTERWNCLLDWHIGYGFSEKDHLLWGVNMKFSKSKDNALRLDQFRSLNWHHYFKKSKENSLMTKLSLTFGEGYKHVRYLTGLGYQFGGNYQIDLYLSTGFKSGSYNQLKLTFSYCAY